MKKALKAISGLLILATMFLFIGAGNNKTIPLRAGIQTTSIALTYANSQVDTLRLAREGTMVGLSVGVHFKDSVSLTNVIVRRIVDGYMLPVVAGDTIIGAVVYAGAADTAKVGTVTLTPLCDEYRFFVTYAGSANGVTTPTAVFTFNRQYYSR